MKTILRGALCALAMAVAALAGPVPASAVQITKLLQFTGTIYEFSDPFSISGLGNSQQIQGSVTLGPMDDAPTGVNADQASFVGHGSLHFGTMSGDVNVLLNSISGRLFLSLHTDQIRDPITFEAYEPRSLDLDFQTTGSSPLLTSLSGLPHDKAGILSYLGGALILADGRFNAATNSANRYDGRFTIDSLTVSNTPIPPSLVLLLTALGGLAIVRRRQQG